MSVISAGDIVVELSSGMDSSVVQLKTVVDEGVVVKVSRQASIRVSEYCTETPYLALKVPDEIDEVVRVSFTTFAHDQGKYRFRHCSISFKASLMTLC